MRNQEREKCRELRKEGEIASMGQSIRFGTPKNLELPHDYFSRNA
jgi:hypothetical protein